MPETTMKVTKDTVTIKELKDWWGHEGQTVQLKDADPNELQLFIEKMPVPIKGESVQSNFQNFVLRTSVQMYGNRQIFFFSLVLVFK